MTDLGLDLTIPNSLIIAGTRTVTEIQFRKFAEVVLDNMIRPALVISGGQRSVERRTGRILGADYWGEQWAKARGIPVKPMPADWIHLGAKAGPIRNRQMAEIGAALFALWDGKSTGTQGMIHEMKFRSKPVTVVRVPRGMPG